MLYFGSFYRRGARFDSGWLRSLRDQLGEKELFRLLRRRPVIFGGGGLLGFDGHNKHKEALEILRRYAESGGPVVIWGAGHNRTRNWIDAQRETDASLYGDLSNFVVGLRDFETMWRWVPCVSALHPSFHARRPKPSNSVVSYWHGALPLPSSALQGLPQMTNIADKSAKKFMSDLEAVLAFLASGEVVVTNSYHGAYWATLLGRRVVAFPNSSKFLGFKHKPASVLLNADLKALIDAAPSYPEALSECRDANVDFRRIVRPYV